MSGFGIAQHEIARMLDIDPKTLRRAFRRELDVGETEANAGDGGGLRERHQA